MDLREHSPTRAGEAGELEQRPITAGELPAPETTEEWQDLPRYPPAIAVPKVCVNVETRPLEPADVEDAGNKGILRRNYPGCHGGAEMCLDHKPAYRGHHRRGLDLPSGAPANWWRD